MNSIGTIWVFVLLVIINLDIGGRALFNHPVRGVPEIVALSIVACVFLQIAHTLKVGRLTRSDICVELAAYPLSQRETFFGGIVFSDRRLPDGHFAAQQPTVVYQSLAHR